MDDYALVALFYNLTIIIFTFKCKLISVFEVSMSYLQLTIKQKIILGFSIIGILLIAGSSFFLLFT